MVAFTPPLAVGRSSHCLWAAVPAGKSLVLGKINPRGLEIPTPQQFCHTC